MPSSGRTIVPGPTPRLCSITYTNTSELMPTTTYLEAIREGLWEEMERDPSVFCIGEDIAEYGGAFKVTAGFLERFGAQRVVDTPISEAGIVGAAIGAG